MITAMHTLSWGHTVEVKVPGAGAITLYQPAYDPAATSL